MQFMNENHERNMLWSGRCTEWPVWCYSLSFQSTHTVVAQVQHIHSHKCTAHFSERARLTFCNAWLHDVKVPLRPPLHAQNYWNFQSSPLFLLCCERWLLYAPSFRITFPSCKIDHVNELQFPKHQHLKRPHKTCKGQIQLQAAVRATRQILNINRITCVTEHSRKLSLSFGRRSLHAGTN